MSRPQDSRTTTESKTSDSESSKNHPTASRPVPQDADTRYDLRREYEDALAVVGRLEEEAGPTLKAEFSKAKRFQSNFGRYWELRKFTRRLLGRRSGLFRLMRQELGTDGPMTDRANLYVEHMLKISANIAALTGSGWPSTQSWLASRLPMTISEPEKLQADFTTYLTEARQQLARRIPSGDQNMQTGPTPAVIAKALGTTTEQIRQAKASRCGLTSIDPPDRKAQDKERKAAKRLKDGMVPQAQRTARADMKALADRLGCSLATIYRKRLDGTLDAFVAAHSQDETKVSALIKEFDSGQISLIDATETEAPQVEARQQEVTVNDELMRKGFTGRTITITPRWAEIYAEEYPHLRDNLPCHFAEIDKIMVKTTEPYQKRVLKNLLGDRNRAAARAKKAA